ncbi:MAG: hypothetical protein KTR13_08160 [Saprospiraceae bacterium]|nr:hypothetical protein [Saprospiraceae bacterium]
MRVKKLIQFLGLSILLLSMTTSCSVFQKKGSKQVACPKPKKNVSKKFSTKRKKSKRPTYSYGGSSASTPREEPVQVASVPPPPPPTPEPEPEPVVEEPVMVEVAVEDPPVQEAEPPSIADSKNTSFPDEPTETVIEFRGQEIDLKQEDFKYNESIEFIDNTDYFVSREEAVDQLKDLSRLLRKNTDINVTIIGNAASSYPIEGYAYGASDPVINQEAELNGKTVTIKDTMLARAGRIFDLLVERGVDPTQLKIETGTYSSNKKDRVVTFVFSTD